MLVEAVAVMVAGSVPTSAINRPAFEWPSDLKGKTVLFAGAHSDDEWGFRLTKVA